MKTLKVTWILICVLAAISSIQAQNSNLSIELLYEREIESETFFNPDTAELMSTANGKITIYTPNGATKYSKKLLDIAGDDREGETKLVRNLSDEELMAIPDYIYIQPWLLPSFPKFSPKLNCFVELLLWPDKSVHLEMFRWSEHTKDYNRLWTINLENLNFGDNSLLWGKISPYLNVSEKGSLGISGVSRIDWNSDRPPTERVEIYNEKGLLIARFEEGKDFFSKMDIVKEKTPPGPGFRVLSGVTFSENSKTIRVSGRSKESYTTERSLFLTYTGEVIWEIKYKEMPEKGPPIYSSPDLEYFIMQKNDRSFWIHSKADEELKPFPYHPTSSMRFTDDGKYIHYTNVDFTGLDRHFHLIDIATQREVVHIKRQFGEDIKDYCIATTSQRIFLLTCNFPPWELKKVSGNEKYHFDIRIYNFDGKELATLSFPASNDNAIMKIEASRDGTFFNIASYDAKRDLKIKIYSVKSEIRGY